MIFKHTDYRSILKEEFNRRNSHNPQYSMRSFARDIQIAPSRLSEILSAKQGLSSKKAEEIAHKLNFNVMETDFFKTLVESIHGRSKLAKESAKIRLRKFDYKDQKDLSLKVFEVISNWQHFAIIELLQLKGAKSSPKWLAEKLSISVEEVKQSLQRLLDVGLIIREKGKYKRIDDSLFIWPTEVPSLSIKKYHQGVLASAKKSLFTTPIEQREFNSLIMPIDQKKLPEAKKMIRDFHIELNKFLTKGRHRDRVYYFSSQLFPVD